MVLAGGFKGRRTLAGAGAPATCPAMMHEPTRTAALERLAAFVPHAGRDYAAKRNYDLPGHPHVSVLSPYVRHRSLTDAEVLEAVLSRHSPSAAEKFIQEVYWRTYWKGWLEMRPSVWRGYTAGLSQHWNHVQTSGGLRRDWEAACLGRTGIDAFDHWAQELVETGYMHNHARMWFASIWIFTLRLPWELGADFFLRHLLDGDPASNTLSWRWVAGLQTKGKTYEAAADNIAKYTEKRFRPKGLAANVVALDGPPHPDRLPAPKGDPLPSEGRIGLLMTEDDLSPGWLLRQVPVVATAAMNGARYRSPLEVAPMVQDFTEALMQDALSRHADQLGPVARVLDTKDVLQWAEKERLSAVVAPWVPVGWTRDALSGLRAGLEQNGITFHHALRPYDAEAWPHATAGFFKFKEKIPALLGGLKGLRAA